MSRLKLLSYTTKSNSFSSSVKRAVIFLLLIQVVFVIIFPTIDTFLDVERFIPLFYKPLFYFHARIVGIHEDSNIICCPGAGFSGFWFSLGRLHNITSTKDNKHVSSTIFDRQIVDTNMDLQNGSHLVSDEIHYECFSAGCLSVVATLSQIPVEHVLDLALKAQTLWREGIIGRYQVVEYFVDGLLEDHITSLFDNQRVNLTQKILSRIHIITSIQERGVIVGMKYVSRTALDKNSLREMLIQTTWIPFVTGNSLWRWDKNSAEWHRDGGFTGFIHPRCKRKLTLPLKPDLLLNSLNPNLERLKAEEFYENGLNYRPTEFF